MSFSESPRASPRAEAARTVREVLPVAAAVLGDELDASITQGEQVAQVWPRRNRVGNAALRSR